MLFSSNVWLRLARYRRKVWHCSAASGRRQRGWLLLSGSSVDIERSEEGISDHASTHGPGKGEDEINALQLPPRRLSIS